MNRHLFIAVVVAALGRPATGVATEPPGAAATDTPSRAPSIEPLLSTLQQNTTASDRLEAATKLAEAGAAAVPAIEKFLARQRPSTDAERRAVLATIKAAVPDKKGKFRTPGRQDDEEEAADDNLDWLAKLLELPPAPGLGDVIADVAAVRALAATTDASAGEALLDFAFTDDGLIYRDECGRYLRKMLPYSLPGLIRAAEITKKYSSKRRYATYQLERTDRENPAKTLEASADDPRLQAAIFAVWRDTKARAPVPVILENLDHVSPLVRAAAREAWMALVTGTPPPEAPKRKLQMPGGELSKKEQPLWYNSRELAEVALVREIERLYGETPPKKASLAELSQKLFAYYDDRRQAAEKERLEAALAAAGSGKWQEATAAFDRILAEHPEHPARAEMAPAYIAAAKALRKDKRWREAAIAFRKAHLLAPDRPDATTLLASYHRALGKALETEGADGSAELRLAATLQPDTHAFEDEGDPGAKTPWLLYAGGGVGVIALFLLVLGLRGRRD